MFIRRAPKGYDEADQNALRNAIDAADKANLKANTFIKSKTPWTPVFSAATPPTGVTYSTQTGYYLVHGTMVFIRFRMILTSKGAGGAGDIIITGLPLVSANDVLTPLGTIVGAMNFSAGYTQAEAYINANAQTIRLREIGDNVAHQDLSWAAAANTSDLAIAGWYEKA